MKLAYSLTPIAIEDLDQIITYISVRNETAAIRVREEILSQCSKLTKFPYAGSMRSHITPLPLRFWTVPRFQNFTIVYSPETVPLEIVSILHGKRDLKKILKKRLQ